MEKVSFDNVDLYLGDCLDILPGLSGIDAVICDPPYYKIVSDAWDRQWKTLSDYIEWIGRLGDAVKLAIADNGSFYIFGDEKVIAYQQVELDKRFTLLNCLVWNKPVSRSSMYAQNLRSYAPMTERILFYTPQACRTGLETVKLDIENFKPLREYFRQYQEAIGESKKAIIDKIGQQADHCFRWGSTQWDLPTKETYQALALAFPVQNFERREYEDLRREYEDLRREYEDLRREYEDLRRVFNATKHTLDVITMPIVNGKDNTEHSTTKPVKLMQKLILDCSNPGFTICDPTMGSGTTGVACIRTGRRFIGIEKDPQYFEIACKRIERELAQGDLFRAA